MCITRWYNKDMILHQREAGGKVGQIMKIVFFDIDGTLYDRGDPRGIPKSTVYVIHELQKEGHLAVICTGRCMSCIEPYIQEVGFDGYIAGCGTHILYRGQELWYQPMMPELIGKINLLCKEEQVMPIFEGSQYLYIDESDCRGSNFNLYHFYQEFYKGKVRPVNPQAEDICKFTIRFPVQEASNQHLQKRADHSFQTTRDLSVKNPVDHSVRTTRDLSVKNSADHSVRTTRDFLAKSPADIRFLDGLEKWDGKEGFFDTEAEKKKRLTAYLAESGLEVLDKGHSLEVYPQGSGKGAGIRRFLDLTGYEQAETYAFGDGVNDITMMEQVNFGIALGHADARLLETCCCETDALYEDGILHACQKFKLID